jgi:L-ascorbate metabolism protein UlaG (beta-lactamase superfamily)
MLNIMTMVPSPSLAPLTLMVTMNAKQGVELMQLVKPDITIPVHFDDFDAVSESLEDFKAAVANTGLGGAGAHLDPGEKCRFPIRR